MIKAKDEAARGAGDPDILEEMPLSVVSGRSIPEIAEGKGAQADVALEPEREGKREGGRDERDRERRPDKTRRRAKARAAGDSRAAASEEDERSKGRSNERTGQPRGAPLPEFVPPSLATLRASAPSGEDWVHEIKFDGYRIQARLDGQRCGC